MLFPAIQVLAIIKEYLCPTQIPIDTLDILDSHLIMYDGSTYDLDDIQFDENTDIRELIETICVAECLDIVNVKGINIGFLDGGEYYSKEYTI